MTQHISSEKARANWRELLDSVADGEEIVIERYGRPVAVLSPWRAADAGVAHEPSPVYQYDAAAREQLKAEIVADVLAEIEAAQMEPIPWREGLEEMHRLVKESGSPFASMTTDEIVEKMRETRRQVFEEMYGHLYR